MRGLQGVVMRDLVGDGTLLESITVPSADLTASAPGL